MRFLNWIFFVVFFPLIVQAQSTCPPSTQTRVMLLGDSWTHIMWNNRTYKDVFDQFGFADKIERGNNTAIGGTTASYWALPGNLAVIQNELQQNPTIDIVLLSIGGNDMLAGANGPQPGWHTNLTSVSEALLFDRIQADMQTIIDGIKSIRSNIEIVFSGYDYLNLVETVINDQTGSIVLTWANLGQPGAVQINSAFARFEQRKVNMANADPHVHYVQGFGLMQFVYGYPGFFPAFSVPAPGQQPPSYAQFPGGDVHYPTPPVALAASGSDAIHLSDEGYKHFVVNQTNAYFLDKFRGNPNATFRSEGGTNDGWVRSDGNLGVGGIRVGDNGSANLYRGIISFNTGALPDNAAVTGASLFINRASLSGINPFASGSLGSAAVDVKTGTFGGAGIEIADYFSAADAVDAGCFIGTATDDGYTIRIDFTANGFSKINKAGQTQFRIYFQNANGALNDYVQFNNGDQTGLLAPYLDVFYSMPLQPATAAVSGDTIICPSANATLQAILEGTAPWTIIWSDGVTENNIQSAVHTRIVTPTASTNYSIITVSDVNGLGTVTGSAQIEVLPDLHVTVIGLDGNYCANSPVTTLIVSPPGGVWTGDGLTGNTFNPALAVVNSGGGLITLNYFSIYNGCNYSEDFSVFVDSNSCSQTGSCTFAPVSGTINCVGATPVVKTYESSGRLWVYADLIPGKTYIASTCDSCGYDSFMMIRDETDSSFIAENDDACGIKSSVTFVAPASGKVGVNLTSNRTYNCNGYPCNPHDCNPYACNPYNCNPFQCNCQTCYQTCSRDDQVLMTCYPGGIQVINGLLTSDCIGVCTGGFCWRIQYQVPYDCNPYTCNCQTCYQTCYDTCYETCYDTCYQTCTDKCGTDNFIPCDVRLVCVDCVVPTASISASNTSACENDSISFSAIISGTTCNTTYAWDFGVDATPASSTLLNPQNVIWSTGGVKLVSFQVIEQGLGVNTYQLVVSFNQTPTGGVLHVPTSVCIGDTVHVSLDSMQNASTYHWEFSSGSITGSGAYRDVVVADSLVQFFVVPFNGVCGGDTFSGSVLPTTLAPPELMVNENSISTSETHAGYQWYLNGVAIADADENALEIHASGNYQLEVTDSNGCSAMSSAIYLVWSGVKNLVSEEISIYPNPASGKLFIKCKNGFTSKSISLFNFLGEEIYLTEIVHSTPQIEIDLSRFCPGVYFLRLDSIGIYKVVKE
ncbi:MAG: GDSL-type esterase/lipase family protein [Chitinophagales bacterium]|nr:GDSL-type esterase/lipase family protein [Chitinophagales bacterium]